MSQFQILEPPPSLDDTNPSIATRRTQKGTSPITRLIGTLLLVGAVLITAVSAVLYIQFGQPARTPGPVQPTAIVVIVANNAPTDLPSTESAPIILAPTTAPTLPPTLAPTLPPAPIGVTLRDPAPDVLGALMIAAPDIQPAQELLYRAPNAFTIAPVRPRAGRMMYRVQVGDTVEKIAKRFGLTQDSIIWNNDITYVNRLPAGYEMTIPPIDGILYRPTSSESIQQIADKFKVSPYAILDSEYNRLSAATPTLVIPANELEIMIPGGSSEKKAIYWKPQVERRAASGSGGGQVSFGGGAGSCGFVSSGGGDGSLGLPLNGYTVIRGYSSYHGGVDLASPTGSPIFASGTGTVIFAGWSDWGYGYTIVLAHTPDLWTLYGHLSRISVSCGQIVPRGAVIGGVGSTGNSTGPHLHFETRVGGDPVNPIQYLGGF